MKYKIFTPTRCVYFYDSKIKPFPGYYKYLKYCEDGDLFYEKIFDAKNDYLLKIKFNMQYDKNNRYEFAKLINDYEAKSYHFNEEMDLEYTAIGYV